MRRDEPAKARATIRFGPDFGLRLRAGDPEAWGDLADVYQERLLRVARWILPRDLSARDAVQTTWLNALKKASRFDATQPPYPWLARICTNVCLNLRKKKRPRLFGAWPVGRAATAGCRLEACDEEVRASVAAALRRLTRGEREAVLLRYLFGLSVKDLALLSNRQPAAVKKSLVRGLNRLREPGHEDELRDALRMAEEGL